MGGCGFHLRGSVTLPPIMEVTYIQDSRPASKISTKLKSALNKNGITLVKQPNSPLPDSKPATAILILANETFGQRLLSAGSTTLFKEYQLSYAITIELKDPDGTVILERQTVNTSREQTFEATQVLARTSEQEKLQREMMEDAIRQIMRRLQAGAQ